jgi:hypothetical protein
MSDLDASLPSLMTDDQVSQLPPRGLACADREGSELHSPELGFELLHGSLLDSSPPNSSGPNANIGLAIASDPTEAGWWEPVVLPGSQDIRELQTQGREQLAQRSRVVLQLETDNRYLRDRLAQLEADSAMAAQEIAAAQEQQGQDRTHLVQALEEAQHSNQCQQILVQTLTDQLEQAQERVGQIERDCAALQQRYSEQIQMRSEAEEACRDLRNRLHRQQQQTLQFKVALEKCIEMPGSVAAKIADLEQQDVDPNPGRHHAPVQPWSAQPAQPVAGFTTLAKLIQAPQINELQLNDLQINEPQINEPQINEPQINEPQSNEFDSNAAPSDLMELPAVPMALSTPVEAPVEVSPVEEPVEATVEASPEILPAATAVTVDPPLPVMAVEAVDAEHAAPLETALDQGDRYCFPAPVPSAQSPQVFSNLEDAVAAVLESQASAKALADIRDIVNEPAAMAKPPAKRKYAIDLPSFPRPASVAMM